MVRVTDIVFMVLILHVKFKHACVPKLFGMIG